jgi:hypothetical protein
MVKFIAELLKDFALRFKRKFFQLLHDLCRTRGVNLLLPDQHASGKCSGCSAESRIIRFLKGNPVICRPPLRLRFHFAANSAGMLYLFRVTDVSTHKGVSP